MRLPSVAVTGLIGLSLLLAVIAGCAYQADVTYNIRVIQPADGATYAPCAPGSITWDSNIPPDQGEVLDLYWRPQGSPTWTWLSTESNTGGRVWTSSPCTPGVYEFRIQYSEDASVEDIVTFTVETSDYYIDITNPDNGSIHTQCAPDTITWDSDIPSSGNTLYLLWRVYGDDDWTPFAYVPNTGSYVWSEAPCTPGRYQLRIEYSEDSKINDVATFIVTDPATEETIRFYVDGTLVAELKSGSQPTAKPVKIAGKSGAFGDDPLSGLCDNVIVRANGDVLIREDPFDELEYSFWDLYGTPSPKILDVFGNPKPCLMTSGDGWDGSGIHSEALYDWTDGFLLQADFYTAEGSYRGLEIGIAETDEPIDEDLNHVIGVRWQAGAGTLECITDIAEEEVPLPTFEQWHTIVIATYPL